MISGGLTQRWTPFTVPHLKQWALWNCRKRFEVVAAGRRSGKTEIIKRKKILRALTTDRHRHRCLFMAPTLDQARDIFWDDLKEMVPRKLMARRPMESRQPTIELVNGARLIVVGMDKPQRAEGKPIDDGVMDEFDDMKPDAFFTSVRPALDTLNRLGAMSFIGKPKGRGNLYQMSKMARDPENADEWSYFHWASETILTEEMIRSAKRTLDPRTYAREYKAEFLDFAGRAYYAFLETRNSWPVKYRPDLPLVVALDFNVSPGVASIMQEQRIDTGDGLMDSANQVALRTCCIGEVWIEDDSNTPMVCRAIWEKYKDHAGEVLVYGDATGGARKTSQTMGNDWDLVRQVLGHPDRFGNRLNLEVKKSNPPQKNRVNCVNARCLNADDEVRFLINPEECPRTVEDLEGVTVIPGTAGEIDSNADKKLTHISDALGYYVCKRWPIESETYSEADLIY